MIERLNNQSSSERGPHRDAAYMPGAEPFELVSGRAGVLLLHGFSGSCGEVRALGKRLHEAGFSVVAPALPGHGTQPAALSDVSRDDFLTQVESAYRDAARRFERVYVVGLSMGGALGLHIASDHPVAALVTISAPVFMSRLVSLTVPAMLRFAPKHHVISNYAAWRGEVVGYRTTPLSSLGVFLDVLKTVRRELPRISVPLLILHATKDQTVPVSNAPFIAAHVGSEQKVVRIVEGGRHLLTLPPHLDEIAEHTLGFLRAREQGYVAASQG